MPSKVRKNRKPRKAGRTKTTKKKTGLNNLEKRQVKDIIANRKEFSYSPGWFNYGNFAAVGGYIQSTITPNSYLPNIYDANSDQAVTFLGFQTGEYLNTSSQAVNASLAGTAMYPLGGYSLLQGSGATEVAGRYMYMQSAFASIQITALPASGNVSGVQDTAYPLEFRILVVRAKRVATGSTPSLNSALFLDYTNDKDGLTMSGSTKEAMWDYRLNYNQFQKIKEIRFELTQPVQPNYGGTVVNQPTLQTPRPSQKNLKIWLPNPKKRIRFSDTAATGLNNHEPLNMDYQNYILIMCSRKSGGAFTYSDTSRAWNCQATGMSKWRDC